MVREDIFGGLKSALTRGYTLKDAMVSFYNAGYKKEDIEEAARKLQYQIAENKGLKDLILKSNKNALNQKSVSLPVYKGSAPKGEHSRSGTVGESLSRALHKPKPSEETYEPSESSEQPIPGEMPKRHKVSNYEPGTGMRVITIVLIVLLVLLLGSLGAVFIFKNQIIQFFNNLLA